ncbi:hypothetical protein [Ruegeria marina]|uniref:Uncharacterized protein n=1 Tax=Ruegeria marina TaxID=639004 RepID=A0A1G6V0Z7_9RHOB|nr:hypothetical protein [Ruegeria marina]SDD46657.1 hypothetical protein SAMN04488239_107196 [Ruegeria marina]
MLDNYNNLTGVAGSDGLDDGVPYTLESSADHGNVDNGHDGGVFDDLDLGFTDGTLNGDASDLWYTLVIDPDERVDQAEFVNKQLAGAEAIEVPVDLSRILVGGPQEVLTVPHGDTGTISFDGFLFSSGDEADFSNNVTLFDATGEYDATPNNAGGIGVGNGNFSQYEGMMVDLTNVSAPVSGTTFDLTRVGGNPPDSVDVLWQVVGSDGLTYDGEDTVNFPGQAERCG